MEESRNERKCVSERVAGLYIVFRASEMKVGSKGQRGQVGNGRKEWYIQLSI